MRATDVDCMRCREDVCMVSLDGKFFTRPSRISRCRFYKSGQYGTTCRSELCATDIEALITFPHGERRATLPADVSAEDTDAARPAKVESAGGYGK